MKWYSGKDVDTRETVMGDELITDRNGQQYIKDSTFNIVIKIIPGTLEVEEVVRDKDGKIVYSGPEREDPNRIEITAREYVSEQFDKPPVSQDMYNDEHNLGTSEEISEDFEPFEDPLRKLINK